MAAGYPTATGDGTAVLSAASASKGSSSQQPPEVQQQQQQPDGQETQQLEVGTQGAASSSAGAAAAVQRPGRLPPSHPAGPCPLCGAPDILVPFVAMPCRHIFCYVCLRAQCEADAQFACPLDGARVTALRRLAVRLPPDP